MDTILSNHSEERTTVAIKGKLDAKVYKQFRGILKHQWSGRQGRTYVLDFSELSHIESSGLGLLLILRDDVRAEGGRVEIVNVRPEIVKVLTLANCHEMFTIH